VLGAADLPDGNMRSVEMDGKSILICHVQGAWYALDNVCTHAMAKMNEGRLRGIRLICPLHGASFDCRTGAVLGAPAIRPLKTYEIRMIGDDIEVAI
jgi:3-phenylpropionate/trans-cinnamate dioxygenase ferredoxin subunit